VLEDTCHPPLTGTGGEAANAEVGSVEESLLIAGPVPQKKDAADIVGGEAVKQFSVPASGRDSADGDAHFGGIVILPAPKNAAGHEARTGALSFPGVASLNVQFAERLSEPAFDGANRTLAKLHVKLASRQICKRVTHNSGSRVTKESAGR
jgi:hypothetical protein